MRSTTILFAAVPLLAVASAFPEALPAAWPEPMASPNPQWGTSAAQKACECTDNFTPPPCAGSWCECRNAAVMACWITRSAKCSVALQTCPGSPTGVGGADYPPCGKGLPLCAEGRICRKVNVDCNDDNRYGVGGCLGLCVPPPPQNQPAQSTASSPWWLPKGTPSPSPSPAPPAPVAPGACPTTIACPPSDDNLVCVQDPYVLTGAPQYRCVSGNPANICGGWRNDQCKQNQLCIRDPRFECEGQGCTGLCA